MTARPAAPVVELLPDDPPCPRAQVTVEPGADAYTITLYRWDSAGRHVVRGAYRAQTSGAFFVVDYEVPAGAPVTYTAVAYDRAGIASAESLPSAPIHLTITGCPWVQDPVDPDSATRWQLIDWEAMEYGRDAAILRPLLSATAIAVLGIRQDPVTEMTVLTKSDHAAAALRQLCAAPVLLIRAPQSWGWPSRYWTVGNLEETRRYPKQPARPDRLFELPLTAVDAPAATLIDYPYTWADVVAYWSSWSDTMADRDSWLALLSAPPGGA